MYMGTTIKARACALALTIAFMFCTAPVSSADQFEDGLSAAQRGDYATALRLLRPLAIQGDALAQSLLGLLYSKGKGVPQDYVEAAKWYRLSAIQGYADAQTSVGMMYVMGLGVPQDYAEAAKWYRLAANQGKPDAQTLLGGMYYNGAGVAQNYAEALKWYRLAAAQGDARAQNNLGLMYDKGQGVPQDYVEAHKWFNLSGVGGENGAVKNRSLVEGKMTREQIELAQEKARTCRSSNYQQCGGSESAQIATETLSLTVPFAGRSGSNSYSAIPMQKDGGTFVVPVQINSAITLNFVIDSGAADVSIPADVVLTLMRTGTLKNTDFLKEKVYVLADGSEVPSKTFRIRSLKVGDKTVENVTGSVAPVKGGLLLGQSFLSRFKSWSIDNGKQTLLLE